MIHIRRSGQESFFAIAAAVISLAGGCGSGPGAGADPVAPPGTSAGGSGGSRPGPSQTGGAGGVGGAGGAGGEATAGTGGSPTVTADASISSDSVPTTDGGAVTPGPGGSDAAPSAPLPGWDDYSWLNQPIPVLWLTLEPGQTIPGPGQPKSARALANVKVIQDHDGTPVARIEGRPIALDAAILLEGRGSSSSSVTTIFNSQRGMNMEFHDGQRNGVGRALLGMPQNADWSLVACGSDKTCIRNPLTYAIGREIVAAAGRWAPRFRWAEVYLNGRYDGVYTLIEKPKDDKFRVNLPNAAPNAPPAEVSYLISANSDNRAFNNFDPFNPVIEFLDVRARMAGASAAYGAAPGNRRWKFRSPNSEDITAPQKAFLQSSFDQMTTTVQAGTGDWRAAIDLPSFLDYYVITELTNNVDAFFKSWYMYRMPQSAGGKWFMGPIWDYDLAYGNANYYLRHCATNTQIGPLARQLTTPAKDDPPPAWAIAPLRDATVRNDLRCRWNALRTGGPLALDKLEGRIDAFVTHLRTAKARDTARWANYPKYIWPNNFVAANWDDDVRYLKFWIRTRLSWVDRRLPGTCAASPNPPPVPQIQPPNNAPASRATEMWAGEALDRNNDYVNILGTTPAQWACPPN